MCSKLAVPFCIPTSNEWAYILLHILATTWYCIALPMMQVLNMSLVVTTPDKHRIFPSLQKVLLEVLLYFKLIWLFCSRRKDIIELSSPSHPYCVNSSLLSLDLDGFLFIYRISSQEFRLLVGPIWTICPLPDDLTPLTFSFFIIIAH